MLTFQEIEAELKCEKGKGKTHAKWTPVSTAFYRLKPDIEITTRIAGEDAHELVETCPCDVFDIEDLGSTELLLQKVVFNNSS